MNKDIAQISYFAHEGEMARSERTIRRLWKAVIMLIVLTIITNVMWMWFVLHYDVVSYEEQDGTSESVQE